MITIGKLLLDINPSHQDLQKLAQMEIIQVKYKTEFLLVQNHVTILLLQVFYLQNLFKLHRYYLIYPQQCYSLFVLHSSYQRFLINFEFNVFQDALICLNSLFHNIYIIEIINHLQNSVLEIIYYLHYYYIKKQFFSNNYTRKRFYEFLHYCYLNC